MWASEASICNHDHGDSTPVSHVRQGLAEERNFLKFGDCASGDFRDFPMRKTLVSLEPENRASGYAVKGESFNPRERERE